jgi:hypothetical protein
MRQLSSRWTWWHKTGFPLCWFGFLGIFTVVWCVGVFSQQVPAASILVLPAMAVFGYIVIQLLVSSLVDEVLLDGDDVIVRNDGAEDRFPLSNVANVQCSIFVNPERITLTLKARCRFGEQIQFLPPPRWLRFGKHPLANELINRIRDGEQNGL